MRTLHRWISIIAAVFLANIAITGMMLSWDFISEQIWGFPGGPPVGRGPATIPLPLAELPALMAATKQAAQARVPDGAVTAIRLVATDKTIQGIVLVNGEHAGRMVFDARTGQHLSGPAAKAPPEGQPLPPVTGHQFLKRLHRGDAIGFPGRYLDLTAGLALLYLTISAFWMYFQMWSRRAGTGRRRLFWR